MFFNDFCQQLNESPWMGTICEVGVGVPFQAAYLNQAGASKTILYTRSPYHKSFQTKATARAVSYENAVSLAWQDFVQIIGEKSVPSHSIFSIASTGSHKTKDESGQTHGWISVVLAGDKVGVGFKTYAFHWEAIKECVAGDYKYSLSREALGDYLKVCLTWLLEKVLLNHWNTWAEAIENYPESLKDILWIDVVRSSDISMEEHLMLAQPNQPLLYSRGIFHRATDYLRKYNRCYRGSFNPPTLAHQKIGDKALFEISVDNARKGKVTLTDLKHRIEMIDEIERPVLITAGVPLFVDLHKLLLEKGASSMEYLVGVDTFNSIVDEKYIRLDDVNFFEDFNTNNINQSAKFLVIPRSSIQPIDNQYSQMIGKDFLTSSSDSEHISSTDVRAGDLTLVSEVIKEYIEEHKLYVSL